MLVVFPIAFFSAALLCDLIAFFGERHLLFVLSYYLSLGGIAGAVAAAIPGLIDLLKTVPPHSSAKKRGIKHGLLNTAVLILFVVSLFIRQKEMMTVVLLLETIAVVLMFMAGWMGATLVHRNQIGVDHRYARAGKWQEQSFSRVQFPLKVACEGDLEIDQMKLLHVNGRRVVLARSHNGYFIFDDRCTHKGGSLAGGVMMCGTVFCPWHGSQFNVSSGECVAGPATAGLQIYGVKVEKGEIWLLKI